MSETKEYQSTHTCAQLDEAIQNYLDMQQSVTNSASSASAAAASAGAASAKAAAAAGSATDAASSAALAQSVTQGQKGYFATPETLRAAYPDASGEIGWWAIVGSTDTIWVWDDSTSAWINTGNAVDLSNYYTKTEVNTALAGKASTVALETEVNRAQAAESALTHALAIVDLNPSSSKFKVYRQANVVYISIFGATMDDIDTSKLPTPKSNYALIQLLIGYDMVGALQWADGGWIKVANSTPVYGSGVYICED